MRAETGTETLKTERGRQPYIYHLDQGWMTVSSGGAIVAPWPAVTDAIAEDAVRLPRNVHAGAKIADVARRLAQAVPS